VEHIYQSKVLPYSAEQMYDLVNDVSQYREFIPYCTHSDIIEQHDQHLSATLGFGFAGFEQKFSTKNTLIPGQRIQVNLLNGPFNHLEGIWTFISRAKDCSEVSVDFAFELNHGFLNTLFNPVLKEVTSRLVQTFADRAQSQYGR
jgi:ribosome-associated toxin RatA of RatAB toxin-antitoxin module